MAHTTKHEVTDEQLPQLMECEKRIGYVFQDKSLLVAALTHASGATSRVASNERLEFLGDAILGAVVCEILYRKFTDYLEGDLTKIKSIVVSRLTCSKISESLGLEEFLILGKGMATSPQVPSSLLSDVFESIVAAIHLDGGSEEAAKFVQNFMNPEIIEVVAGGSSGNYKSMLQQLAQRENGTTPTYKLLDEKGPDHAKCFQICAVIGNRTFEPAWGKNKKEAEQRAAENALSQINEEEIPYPENVEAKGESLKGIEELKN